MNKYIEELMEKLNTTEIDQGDIRAISYDSGIQMLIEKMATAIPLALDGGLR